ncbi:MAG: transposase [Candidatus Omnitrophota bacterium]
MAGNRKSIRLKNYDYSKEGAHYVTICAHDRKCIFGDVQNGEVLLNGMGNIVKFTWLGLPQHNKNVELDEYIVMPNHMHGIIKIVGAGSKPARNDNQDYNTLYNYNRAGLEPAPTWHGLSEIVRQFKTFSAKRINQMNETPGTCLWQRNFYEHVIRDESDLTRIREYIRNNPAGWEKDEYYCI